MGTDIFTYLVLTKDGCSIVIDFKSGQSVGLHPSADANDPDALEIAAPIWVSAFCEDKAFADDDTFTARACCPLSLDARWREESGDIIIPQFSGDVEALKLMLEGYSHRGYGTSSSDGVVTASVSFCSVDEARRFMVSNGDLEAYDKNVVDGPEYISHYDYPASAFEGFVESVELLEVYKENEDEELGYWNTHAKYKITMTDPKWIEHIEVGASWDGR
mmetsp:Transcript_23112/g.38026  ORF Transcript_23112/g.38026 Transcript_23112/m.38026 type:complete len:218 (+) Transcript_23112:48-701(+)